YVFMDALMFMCYVFFFFSSRRRHTRSTRDWSSDVCSSDLDPLGRLLSVKREAPTCTGHRPVATTRLTEPWLQLITRESGLTAGRSEERRVGKECRSRGVPDQ